VLFATLVLALPAVFRPVAGARFFFGRLSFLAASLVAAGGLALLRRAAFFFTDRRFEDERAGWEPAEADFRVDLTGVALRPAFRLAMFSPFGTLTV